jgi:protein gp37
MGENSKIEWTHHTFNPWVGCTKVGPPCDNCYAESWAKRIGHPELWSGERRRTTAANWRQPLKWNDAARERSIRCRVFCASLADVFDNQAPAEWRSDLWLLIANTPHLDWLLLTKRPQNIAKMLPLTWREAGTPPNVWLGMTSGNQDEFDRDWPHLWKVKAAVRFVSYEPALGPLDIWRDGDWVKGLDWIICGGESGPRARMMDPLWARALHEGCAHAGIAFFMKQMTAKAPIPDDLMVRQFPR